MMNKKLKILTEKLSDERSKKILLVSHCILNENTRYLGGAFCKGCNSVILNELCAMECGIVQLPCPEQTAWGGVLKKYIWLSINTNGKPVNMLLRRLFPLFIMYTRFVYYKIGLMTIRLIKDYIKSEFEIIGVVGVDGSPTCGVKTTLSMQKSFRYFSGLAISSLDRTNFNTNLYKICLENGPGMFIEILSGLLKKNNINVKLFSIDLNDEMNKKKLKLYEHTPKT